MGGPRRQTSRHLVLSQSALTTASNRTDWRCSGKQLIGVYMLTQGRSITTRRLDVSPALLHWLRNGTFLLLAICVSLTIVTRGMVGAQIAAGKSMGFEISSYLSLFPMALISVGILLVMVWKAADCLLLRKKRLD